MVLGRSGSVSEGRKIILAAVQDGERGDPGGPGLPNIFNILVDTVVRVILLKFCRPQEAHHGLGWAAGEHNIFFYADSGCIAGRNPI